MNRIIYFLLVFLFMSISYTQNLDVLNSGLLDINTSGLAEGLNGELFIGVDYEPGDIYKSTNGGMDWEIIGDSVIWEAEHIVVNSSGDIFAAGNAAGVIRSTNFGQSWDELLPFDIRALAIAENDYLYVGVDDSPPLHIARSTDNGETWEDISGIISNPVYSISTSGSDVFAGTDDGIVYYSSNFGTSWVQTSLSSNLITVLSIDESGDVFAGTWGDGVYRSTDLGSSWNKIFDSGGSIASIVTSVQGYLYAAIGRFTNNNSENIFRSSDNGLTWDRIENGFTANSISIMMSATDNSLYITTLDQGVFKSTNFGDGWFNVGLVTSINNESKLFPDEYKLEQNYPNPFNPTTVISYQILQQGFVTLRIFDLLGKEVATLVNEEKPAGVYEVSFNAADLASGVYIYRMKVNDFIESKKMLLLR